MIRNLICLAATGLALMFCPGIAHADTPAQGFTFNDTPGDHLDVLLDGKLAARFMYAHDTSSKERRLETYKPYLHVYDAEGKSPITKGPGGEYTHHRGIFIGWMKVTFDGQKYDTWHMPNSDIITRKIVETKGGPDEGSFTAQIDWVTNKGVTIIDEHRTMTFHRGPAPARLTIDFTSNLKAAAGDLTLDGDPEHAGVQFRPANEVDRKKTLYFFPVEHPVPHKDLDYPWVGETFTLNGKQYSVVDINSPENPKGTRFSTYRDYGRFGAFPKTDVKSGQTLVLKYRFIVADGPMLPAEFIEKSADQFTGATTP
ncbi:MAG TPA: DUF6807 family protein, partial [Tepidisphaeraceae bacterium]|nr:DUF6807 family protein [Tepidisphaeraceae bacterium]